MNKTIIVPLNSGVRLLRGIMVLFLLGAVMFTTSDIAVGNDGKVIVIVIDGPLGPATSDYVLRGFEKASDSNAELILLKLDTPGGLDTAMRDIIQGIISSPIPVASFVSPSGARAASAGTYIMMASHIAAMAPATTLGAATPVVIGGVPKLPKTPVPDSAVPIEGESSPEQNVIDKPIEFEAARDKAVNDAAAYMRGLAQLRGRNIEWAEQAVLNASSLSAEEAIEINVIDMIASDTGDLMEKLNGHSVTILGQERKLETAFITVHVLEPDWRSQILSVITDPNILPILMTLGMLGLIYEMLNPGFVLPGVIGGICLLLALYAAQVLPVNYAGLALILLGLLFMIGEVFVPSFGVLGIGGVIAFVIGSVILIDTDAGAYGVSIPFISTFAVVNALALFSIVTMVVKSRNRPVVSGREELIGSTGNVFLITDSNTARIKVHGEDWQAKSIFELRPGQQVKVVGTEGLTLVVEPESKIKEELS